MPILNKKKSFIKQLTQADNPSRNIIIKILLGFILIAAIVIEYPTGESIEYYNIGSLWTGEDLYAPFSFPIYKDLYDYEKEKQKAVNSVYPVFDYVSLNDKHILSKLDSIIDYIFSDREKTSFESTLASFADSIHIFSEHELIVLDKLRREDQKSHSKLRQDFQKNISVVFQDILKSGIVNDSKYLNLYPFIAIRKNKFEEIVSSKKVFDSEGVMSEFENRFTAILKDDDAVSIAKKIARYIIQSNLIYNANLTATARDIAQDNVPRTVGYVQVGEHIISKHDRITEESKLKLASYRRTKIERSASLNLLTHRVGVIIQIILIVGLFTFYLSVFRKKIFQNNSKLALIVLIFLIILFFGYLSVTIKVPLPIQYLIFVPAASMLLTIIFDSRVAFYGTVTLAFLIAGLRGNDYSIALASLIAGSFSVYTVRDIRNRTQIFRSIIFIFIGYSVVISALVLERFEDFNTLLIKLSFAMANAVFSSVLTYGLLILFERIFDITTDLKLAELSETSHPLLEQLSEKAPGTFHHSMTLGNLSEEGADAIGANAILARVGAYYHDIGKVVKPEYFVENQVGNVSRHTRLKPRMSALILTSHVKEGIELGRQHRLPEVVLDFIPQHHGTTRISYFFDKALKQAAARKNPKDTIQEEDFRYPGPKPQTKEAGIVMLADSVEAATRAIAEMTPQKLESVIDNMIKQRFVEGQLDECELTLRDLSKIKEAFLKILIGIHHQRIEYPEQEIKVEQQITQTEVTQPVIEVSVDKVPIAEEKSEEVTNVQKFQQESTEQSG